MISRRLETELRQSLTRHPVTAILGPRQCGKSTLAKHLMATLYPSEASIYLDLERPSDLSKLDDPEWFLGSQRDKLICIDEIQRIPELFPVIRSLVDQSGRNGQFLILGSASRDLIRQSSETLAGRISYKRLTPFLMDEVRGRVTMEQYLSRGGFPKSVLVDDDASYGWRNDFITTFLERDLLQFAGFTPVTMRRLWTMLAHSNGQTVNASVLGSSLGISHTTVRTYIDLLEGTFMVRQLAPVLTNTGKRLVKTPKVYLTDTGITTALLRLRNFEQTVGHPVFGSLWESIVLEHVSALFPSLELGFYRTNHGNEVDLVLSDGTNRIVVECKASHAPSMSKGNHTAIRDIEPLHTFVVIPADAGYPLRDGMDVVTLDGLFAAIPGLLKM